MNFDALKKYLDGQIKRGVPGCELIVMRDHEVLFHECRGFSDEEGRRPAAPSDRYWLYSCTKPVTAAAAMRAMEMGLFTLDTPAGELIPAWKKAFTRDGPLENPVTVRHFLTMSAGVDYTLDPPARKQMREIHPQFTSRELAEALAKDPLDFVPGTKYQYSLCLDVVSALIEAAAGIPYPEFLRQQFLEPLGMAHTSFEYNEPRADTAALWQYDSQTKKLEKATQGNVYAISRNWHSGGAGLLSTAMDYARFGDALACGGVSGDGKRVLKQESIDCMRSDAMLNEGLRASFACTAGKDYSYGLGVRTRIHAKIGTPTAYQEFGWDGAAGADLTVDPAHHLSMVYVQHVLGWVPMLGIVHSQLVDQLYPEVLKEEK